MLPTGLSSSSSSDGQLSNGDQLNGWKEIAAHLGKSVRAAQRWEREIGLPVHRIRTVAGQTVFASRREIDEWRRTAEVPRDDGPVEEAPAADPRTSPPSRTWWAWLLVTGLAAAAVVVGFALHRVMFPPERPVRFQLIGQDLEARAGGGRLVWTHHFPPDVGPLSTAYDRPQLRAVQAADLDGDGRQEVVVLVQKGAASNRTPGIETIDVLSERGRLRWSYVPSVAWTFEGRRFEGPWVILDLLIAGPPGASKIWVAYGHNTWWPSFVVRIDAGGHGSVRFVQPGLIYGLGYWTHDGRGYVLAAGVNNAYASASVAVLDAAGAPAVAPQARGSAYHCDDCPAGAPLKYLLFPRTELSKLSSEPYNAAVAIGANVASLRVTTSEWSTRDAAAMYRLSPAFDPVSVDFTDGYWRVHRQLEASGRLEHTAEHCPERTTPQVVREWSAGVWRSVEVPVRLALVPGGGAP
jgi:hypothetical protein